MSTLLGRLLALWCLISAGQALRAAAAREVDPVRTLEAEFRALAGHLPPRGVIGYLPPATDPASAESLRLHYVAKYALAPRVVVLEVGPDFLIVTRGAERTGGDPRLEGFYAVATTRAGHRVFRRFAP